MTLNLPDSVIFYSGLAVVFTVSLVGKLLWVLRDVWHLFFFDNFMLSATKAIGQKKKRFAEVAEWDFSSKLRKLNSLWAAVFATNKQDRTNVEIVTRGCCNQGLCGAFHRRMGKIRLLGASLPGRAGYMWLRKVFWAGGEGRRGSDKDHWTPKLCWPDLGPHEVPAPTPLPLCFVPYASVRLILNQETFKNCTPCFMAWQRQMQEPLPAFKAVLWPVLTLLSYTPAFTYASVEILSTHWTGLGSVLYCVPSTTCVETTLETAGEQLVNSQRHGR